MCQEGSAESAADTKHRIETRQLKLFRMIELKARWALKHDESGALKADGTMDGLLRLALSGLRYG